MCCCIQYVDIYTEQRAFEGSVNFFHLTKTAAESYRLLREAHGEHYCGSLLELLSRVEITVFDVCESFLLNKGALVAQINDLHF